MRLKNLKNFGFKSALAILTFSAMSLFSQAPSHAQVNKKLLSDVIKSCHRDMNDEYFKTMGFEISESSEGNLSLSLRRNCINVRYRHFAMIEKVAWLPYSGEIVQGYSASVAIHVLSLINSSGEDFLSCIVSQDPNSQICRVRLTGIEQLNHGRGRLGVYDMPNLVSYLCPKCVIAYDDSTSVDLRRGVIRWFLSLDKPKRQEIISFFSSGEIFRNSRSQASNAVNVYDEALRKIEQEGKERSRRDLLGQ